MWSICLHLHFLMLMLSAVFPNPNDKSFKVKMLCNFFHRTNLAEIGQMVEAQMGLCSVCRSKSTGLDLAKQSNSPLQISALNQHAGFRTCVFEQAQNTKREWVHVSFLLSTSGQLQSSLQF